MLGVSSRHGVIVICNHNELQSITVFQAIIIDYPLKFCKVIVIIIEYNKNLIVIVITFTITLALYVI